MSIVDLAELPRILDAAALSRRAIDRLHADARRLEGQSAGAAHLAAGQSAAARRFRSRTATSARRSARWSPDSIIDSLSHAPGRHRHADLRAADRRRRSAAAVSPRDERVAGRLVARRLGRLFRRHATRRRPQSASASGCETTCSRSKRPSSSGISGRSTVATAATRAEAHRRRLLGRVVSSPSRDGRRIALHRSPTPLAGRRRPERGLGRWTPMAANAPLGDEQRRRGDRRRALARQLAGSLPRRSQPAVSSPTTRRRSSPCRPPAGRRNSLLADFPYAIERASWTSNGDDRSRSVNMGVHSEIFRIDVAARRARALTDGQHSVQFWSLVPAAGRIDLSARRTVPHRRRLDAAARRRNADARDRHLRHARTRLRASRGRKK